MYQPIQHEITKAIYDRSHWTSTYNRVAAIVDGRTLVHNGISTAAKNFIIPEQARIAIRDHSLQTAVNRSTKRQYHAIYASKANQTLKSHMIEYNKDMNKLYLLKPPTDFKKQYTVDNYTLVPDRPIASISTVGIEPLINQKYDLDKNSEYFARIVSRVEDRKAEGDIIRGSISFARVWLTKDCYLAGVNLGFCTNDSDEYDSQYLPGSMAIVEDRFGRVMALGINIRTELNEDHTVSLANWRFFTIK